MDLHVFFNGQTGQVAWNQGPGKLCPFTNQCHLTKLVLHQAQLNQSFQRLRKQVKSLSQKNNHGYHQFTWQSSCINSDALIYIGTNYLLVAPAIYFG